MRYLVDTHICLWAIYSRTKLSERVKALHLDAATELIVSSVSLWEIAVKFQVGKMPEFPTSMPEFVESLVESGFAILPLTNEHINAYFSASYFIETHKDPFDRLLLATANAEKMAFITKDEKFKDYTEIIDIVW